MNDAPGAGLPRPSLDALLAPRSVAIVGASDRSRWSTTLFANLRAGAGGGPDVALVNPRGGTVHGETAHLSPEALPHPVDLGIVLVPSPAVADVVESLGRAGARAAMILTSGFAETGEAGAALQERVAAIAAAHDMALLGPNSLGFINYAAGINAWATPLGAPSRHEGVAILSQSGATAFFLGQLAVQQDVGLSHIVASGNEAGCDLTALMDYLIERPEVRSLALFVETVRLPGRFIACAERALAAGKPIVVLKVGRSEVTARSAEAHTGALVGDDAVFDGICRQYGILRVDSVEDLLFTADIAGRTGPLRPGGLAVLSNSGGICEIAADRAAEAGLALPPLSEATVAALRETLPDFGTPHNPLDLTGAVDPAQCERIVGLLGAQEDVAVVLCPYYPVPADPAEESDRLTALHRGLTRGLSSLDVPGLLVSYTQAPVTAHARAIVARDAMPYAACGLDRAITALSKIAPWSRRLDRGMPGAGPRTTAAGPGPLPRSEAETLDWLHRLDVPVVPHGLAATRAEAERIAGEMCGLLVVKVASPDIAHKSDIGGVALNVAADAAGDAFDAVTGAGRRADPSARIDGALMAPMRPRGVELLVGVSRDPQWGPILAVGLGGVFVEVLKDVALRRLPVTQDDVQEMLDGLRGAALLDGARGTPAADRVAIARAVQAIGDAALAAGEALAVLEVNPLWVRGAEIEALDALMECRPEAAPKQGET